MQEPIQGTKAMLVVAAIREMKTRVELQPLCFALQSPLLQVSLQKNEVLVNVHNLQSLCNWDDSDVFALFVSY